MKTLLSILIAATLFSSIVLLEQKIINNTFLKLQEVTVEIKQKACKNSLNENDMYNLFNQWSNSKRKLYFFIPHNDIKEIDLWINELYQYVKANNTNETISKLDVIISLFSSAPKFYRPKINNII